MNVREVAEVLQSRIGVDPLSLGSNVLVNIVANRMRVLGLKDPERYVARLRDSAEELATLIDDVVVPETWFFRGGKVFDFLADHARQALQAKPLAPTFRILSAPCSTGEEPYSMAIALVEAGIPHERWTVEGIDLSPPSLARAGQGVYREMSFRETPERLRRQYFQEQEGGWRINASLREKVHFRQGNLIDPDLLRGEQPFDLIFCRNVLIYLNADAREDVLANLDRLLAPNGLLCMGHAEPLNLIDPRFQATGPHDLFLFQRRREPDRRRAVAAGMAPISLRKDLEPTVPAPRRSYPPRSPSVSAVPAAEVAPVELLLQARREADAGSLDKARQTCRAYLSTTKTSAHAYSLLGVIHQAQRERAEAIDCFRRALYLDPQHEEALLHLLLLYQEEGNQAAALRLRRRLERKSAGGEA